MKLKRLRLKKEIPKIVDHIINLKINNTVYHVLKKKDRRFLHNTINHKWYELIDEVE